eukprot:TRINITY_DN13786_c0_g2_i2.p1 TRINITY_DN13786_c0_g2~~TRINITY_DN13786_c0_g2_i2.p1  ORF type:complete len:204 (+),score=31.69 TRINITY_DN13786_c0_g2_i2:1-612(+)
MPMPPPMPPPPLCHQIQEDLDRQACSQASERLRACNAYNQCFNSTNATWSRTWHDICGLEGEIEALKNELYTILRIECLVLAINASSAVDRHNLIDDCMRKTKNDYNLSLVEIPECLLDQPPYRGLEQTDCRVATNVSGDVNTSGTTPYEEFYYQYVKYPEPCKSDCCMNPLPDFQPLTDNLLLAPANYSLLAASADEGVVFG